MMVYPCEHCTEPCGFLKPGEFCNQLSN